MIKKIIDRLMSNKTSSSMFLLAAVLAGLISAINACSLADSIKVSVPPGISAALEIESKIPLSETGAVWDDWEAYVKRESAKFTAKIDKGHERFQIISSLADMGINAAKGPLSSLPFGGAGVAMLAGLGGLFLKDPRADKRTAKEKEASYNEGMVKAATLIKLDRDS